MLGGLNAPPMGSSAPPQGTAISLGRLAADFDRAAYENGSHLKIASVVPLGPAVIAGLKAGDYVTQVDGHPVGARGGKVWVPVRYPQGVPAGLG